MGILLNFFDDHIAEALSRKKAFKPNTHFDQDAVPSASAQDRMVAKIPGWKPGNFAPDPIKSIPADGFDGQAFKPSSVSFDENGEITWSGIDPVPAKGVE